MATKKLKVIELFAGVGGFRIGLERAKNYEVVWSNQWEPMTKTQHASDIYEARFGHKGHSNIDIEVLLNLVCFVVFVVVVNVKTCAEIVSKLTYQNIM